MDFKTRLPDRLNGRKVLTLNNLKEIIRRADIYFDFSANRPYPDVMYGYVDRRLTQYDFRNVINLYVGLFRLPKTIFYYAGRINKSKKAIDFLITLAHLDAIEKCLELEYAQQ